MNPPTVSLDMKEKFGEPNKVTDTTDLRRFMILRKRIDGDVGTGRSFTIIFIA